MGVAVKSSRAAARLSNRLRAKAGVALIALAAFMLPASAQVPELEGQNLPRGEQMLLTADTLVYDQDRNTVTAVGGVQIEYAGNRLVAQRVTYDRGTSRVIASGNVEIVEEDGNRIYADQIDVTDDFSEGFVDALRVETVDRTYFAAEGAERTQGRLTTFNRAVYTACEPCEENPDRPPLWQVKARKVIWDGQAKTIRFEHARLEMFGLPIAWLPAFEIADPTVKRKSGFLMPSIRGGSELGIGVRVPYYFALSPTYDATVAVTPYTKQGFLAEGEWRQQFNNGYYSLQVAGISQQNPDEWPSGHVDSRETSRAMIGSKGAFEINPRWSFGWDVMAQTDKNFSKTYGIDGFSDTVHRSQAYLTGLNDRNYFDLRGYHFQVQESTVNNGRHEKQPWVLPVFDYSYTPDTPVAGGELNIDVNAQSLYRDKGMYYYENNRDDNPVTKAQGLEGESGRLTAEAEWRRSYVTEGGLVVTPILHARGDAIYASLAPGAVNAVENFAGDPSVDIQSAYYRSMATAGLETRWPILFSTASSVHIVEPMAQVFARPNEPYRGRFGIPNEDAQSLVFDASTLFERDKFSGYDRIEGGTRANLGLRYSGSFVGGWAVQGLFGQSYHLAGENSYAAPDLVNVGAYSGLETDVSDFVGMVGVVTPIGLAFSAGGRFDEQTFEVRRAELKAAGNAGPVTASLRYAYIQSQPGYGFDEDRREITAQSSVRFAENWRAFASGTFDLEKSVLVQNTFGFAYDDECFTYLMSVSQERNRDTEERSTSFGITVSLRTLGEIGTSSGGLFGR